MNPHILSQLEVNRIITKLPIKYDIKVSKDLKEKRRMVYHPLEYLTELTFGKYMNTIEVKKPLQWMSKA